MSKGPIQDNCLSNINISDTIINSDQVYYLINWKWMKWDKAKDKIDEMKVGVG